MIRAVILLVLAACASSKSAEQHAEVGVEAHGEQQAETHSDAHAQETVFRHSIRVAERFTADGGVAARVVTDTSTGTDRSYVASAEGTSGAEQQTTLHAASEAHSASKRSYWPPVTYLLVGLLAAAAGLWLARKRLAPLLGIIGRIF